MKRSKILPSITLLLIPAFLAAQTRIDLRSQAKSVDFTNSASTKPFKSGTALPAACSVGETFFKTDAVPGRNIFACTAANVWTLQASSADLPAVSGQSGKVLSNNGTTADWRAIGGDLSGSPDNFSVTGLRGRPVASTTPTDGQVLKWNQTAGHWQPAAESGDGSGGSLPPQSGFANHLLATDGVSASWRSLVGGATGALAVTSTANEVSVDLLPAVIPFLSLDNVWSGKQIYTPSAVQNLTSASTILANRQNVQVASASSVAITSTPSIADGQNGQVLLVANVNSANSITLSDESQLSGSNIRFKGGANRTLNPRESVQLVFNSVVGDWIEVGGGSFTADGGEGTSFPTTSQGDLIVHNGSANVRLPAGPDQTLLTADSSQASGVRYRTAKTKQSYYLPLVVGYGSSPLTEFQNISSPATGAPARSVYTGAATAGWRMATANFAYDTSTTVSASTHLLLPEDWDGGDIEIRLPWFTVVGGGGADNKAVKWFVKGACVGTGEEMHDPNLGAAQGVVSTTGAAYQNKLAVAKMASMPKNGCEPGEHLNVQIYREASDPQDTLIAGANLTGVEIILTRNVVLQ
jgi:hypothetical protein